ncbi:MAG: coenzyme-B sulfoethylthiotransferase subunit beta [Methanophagales archaeon ANME-1-THS]|nr:MAG: coenzyme-B sulfoethylthiotransferase subunit beta [Methanophagales archaeon ANME-1-THS]
MGDKVDLYDDKGKKLLGDVPISALSPLKNPAIRKICSLVARSAAIDLAGLANKLKTGTIAGKAMVIRGKSMNIDAVGKAKDIATQMKAMLEVESGDETKVEVLSGGKRLLVQVPSARILADYSAARTNTCAALTQAIIDTFKVDMWHAPDVKAAVWGMYPQDPAMTGSVVATLVDVPISNEGPGYTLRNIPVNHIAATVRKRAIPGACLSMILEEAACYEMGDAIGPFERGHLLDLAFEGLNANNMLCDLIMANGEKGTLADVVYATVEQAKKDGVIKAKQKMGSGYTVFGTDDLQMWNAYAAAGMLAATCVNAGALRAGQPVPSCIMYFNELIEHETGLPGVDYGKCQGASVASSFFSHSIYGGGGPGVFHGNHIVTRHAKGQFIPCFTAAMCLDADTLYFTPARTSALMGEVLGTIPEFAEPMKAVAAGAKEIM